MYFSGVVHSGMGETAVNKLLSCLNVPSISPHLYKRYEREIGPALEAVAKHSCKRAAREERRYRERVIENLNKLCRKLQVFCCVINKQGECRSIVYIGIESIISTTFCNQDKNISSLIFIDNG